MVWHLVGKVMKYLLKPQQIDVFFWKFLLCPPTTKGPTPNPSLRERNPNRPQGCARSRASACRGGVGRVRVGPQGMFDRFSLRSLRLCERYGYAHCVLRVFEALSPAHHRCPLSLIVWVNPRLIQVGMDLFSLFLGILDIKL